MKKTLLTLASVFLFGAVSVFAQSKAPEFNNVVMRVNAADGTVASLEKLSVTTGTSSSIGSGKMYMEAAGGASSTILSATDASKFIVKLDPSIDPESVCKLYVMRSSKKNRKVDFAKVGMGGMTNITDNQIPFSVEKVEPGLYYLIPKAPLAAGEYMFVADKAAAGPMGALPSQGFCFQVK